MNSRHLFLLPALASLLATAHARLGDTEAQSQARYGEPKPEYAGADDKPLIAGAKHVIYGFEGWRIRTAYAGGVAHKMEYVKIPDTGKLKPITEEEAKAILDAEKGQATYKWREEKARLGNEVLNSLKKAFDGREWERSDHAKAKLVSLLGSPVVLVLESKDADTIEKKLAKEAAKAGAKTPAKPGAPVPKF